MTKSQLIQRIAHKQSLLTGRDVELAVNVMLEHGAACLAEVGRIEIRVFGSFWLHFRPPRAARNPKTGTPISLPARYAPTLGGARRCASTRSVDARSTRGFGRRITVHRGTRARGPH